MDKLDFKLSVKWSEVAQSCPTLCDPMDCSLPGSSLHGILQARELEWVAISFSRGYSWPRDWTRVSRIPGRHFNLWATREGTTNMVGINLAWEKWMLWIIIVSIMNMDNIIPSRHNREDLHWNQYFNSTKKEAELIEYLYILKEFINYKCNLTQQVRSIHFHLN